MTRDGRELVPRVRDREGCFSRHERWLRAVVRSLVGEPQAVDEVMQEVALAAVGQEAVPQEASRWRPWLYRLAVRQSLLYRRRQGRHRRRIQRYAERIPDPQGTRPDYDPLALLLREERRGLIRVAVGRLRHRDSEVLYLKYTEGWSYRQIAEHTGLSESAVEARLHRARARLRAALAALQVIEVRL
jgi:RNA polymerase sigma-70 factor (ECF subfamily)